MTSLRDMWISGIGSNGQPLPIAKVNRVRARHGLEPLPADHHKKSRGLGDTVAKFTHATRLDVLADKVAKAAGYKDCGCKGRQEALNKLVPYE